MAGEHQVEGATVALGQAYGGAAQYFAMWVVGSTLDAVAEEGRVTTRDDAERLAGARVAVEDTPEEAAFRAEVREWFAANATRTRCRRRRPATTSRWPTTTPEAHAAHVAQLQGVAAQALRRRLGRASRCRRSTAAGAASAGRSGSSARSRRGTNVDTGLFAVVARAWSRPRSSCTAPRSRSSATSSRCCAATRSGASCSPSPAPGSDLAGLTTRAIRDGDTWIVNGQKVWNSGAHHADFGILMARTDIDVPKHRGITYFLVDMHTPGVDVRPLRQATGVAHFNEVFLTDVHIPHENVLGEVNGGWAVAQTTLMHERNMIGSGGMGIGLGDYLRLARDMGVTDDPHHAPGAREVLHAHRDHQVPGRAGAGRGAGGQAAGAGDVAREAVRRRCTRRSTAISALQLEGAGGMLTGADALRRGMFQQLFLGQWGMRLGGGTEQIQRNVIGERVLGLPGEPRPDKTLPFKDIPKNSPEPGAELVGERRSSARVPGACGSGAASRRGRRRAGARPRAVASRPDPRPRLRRRPADRDPARGVSGEHRDLRRHVAADARRRH